MSESAKRIRSPGGTPHSVDISVDNDVLTADADVRQALFDVQKNLTEQMSHLNTQFKQITEDLRAEFDLKLTKLSSSIDTRIADASELQLNLVRKEIEEATSSTEQQIVSAPNVTLSTADEKRIDKLERDENLNTLVISGIPVTDNEKMKDIVYSICNAINYKRDVFDTIADVYRFPMARVKAGVASSSDLPPTSSRPILVRFYTFDSKQQFFSSYLKSKANLSQIGFDTSKRFFINEKLTPKNRDIFSAAKELKSNGKILSYYTYRGLVYAKKSVSSEATCIFQKSELFLL